MLKIVSKSEKGMREANEDAILVSRRRNNKILVAVADGMGGHKAGDVASELAIKILEKNFLLYNETDYLSFLEKTYEEINNEIYKQSLLNHKYENMGTTLTSLIIDEDKMYTANVGDSRIYYINKSTIRQITKDHTLVEYMLDNGEITQKEAKQSNLKNILLQAMGTNNKVTIDLLEYELPLKYKFILCSDGLYESLSDVDMYKEIKKNKNSEEIVNNLIEEAMIKGSSDNISVILVEKEEEDEG